MDDVMFAHNPHNQAGKDEANTAYTQTDSPGGGAVGDAWCLRLPGYNLWKMTTRRLRIADFAPATQSVAKVTTATAVADAVRSVFTMNAYTCLIMSDFVFYCIILILYFIVHMCECHMY